MRKVLCAIALAIPVVVFAQAPADSISPRATQLHDRAIVVDSRGDTTQRLILDEAFDIGKRNPNGNIDIQRLREGGLDLARSSGHERSRPLRLFWRRHNPT